ncbi:PREDICTED: uncharacterized protein LOC106818026 [Priapulus caudatus]|uniref:Protein DP71L n=1 Tax=Priapulus caudatus TaxID=37621 RepID=A0ABM1F1A4_PRICU|nr:PREDICTED: uncharacterized protein LOC106818026 [Priapulus caudatus]
MMNNQSAAMKPLHKDERDPVFHLHNVDVWPISELLLKANDRSKPNMDVRKPIFARLDDRGQLTGREKLGISAAPGTGKMDFNIGHYYSRCASLHVQVKDPHGTQGFCNMKLVGGNATPTQGHVDWKRPMEYHNIVPSISFASILKKPPYVDRFVAQGYSGSMQPSHYNDIVRNAKPHSGQAETAHDRTQSCVDGKHTKRGSSRFGDNNGRNMNTVIGNGAKSSIDVPGAESSVSSKRRQLHRHSKFANGKPPHERGKGSPSSCTDKKSEISNNATRSHTSGSASNQRKRVGGDVVNTGNRGAASERKSAPNSCTDKRSEISNNATCSQTSGSASNQRKLVDGDVVNTGGCGAAIESKSASGRKRRRRKRRGTPNVNWNRRNEKTPLAELQKPEGTLEKYDCFDGKSIAENRTSENEPTAEPIPTTQRSYANVVTCARTASPPHAIMKTLQSDSKFDIDKLDGLSRNMKKYDRENLVRRDEKLSASPTTRLQVRTNVSSALYCSQTRNDSVPTIRGNHVVMLQRPPTPEFPTVRSAHALVPPAMKRSTPTNRLPSKDVPSNTPSVLPIVNSEAERPVAAALKDQLITKPSSVSVVCVVASVPAQSLRRPVTGRAKASLTTRGTQTNISQVANAPLFVHVACRPAKQKKPSAKKLWQGELRELVAGGATSVAAPPPQQQHDLCEAAVQCDITHGEASHVSYVQHFPAATAAPKDAASPRFVAQSGPSESRRGPSSLEARALTDDDDDDDYVIADGAGRRAASEGDLARAASPPPAARKTYTNTALSFILGACSDDSDFNDDWSSEAESEAAAAAGGDDTEWRCMFEQHPLLGGLMLRSSRGLETSASMPSLHVASDSSSPPPSKPTERGLGESAGTAEESNSKKQVKFAKNLVKIHPIICWAHAYRAARKGPWEEYARDRSRFQRRICTLEPTLAKHVNLQHRDAVYKRMQECEQERD